MIDRAVIEALSDKDLRQLVHLALSVSKMRRITESASARLSRLAAGESELFSEWDAPEKLNGMVTRFARLRIGDETARWSARTTTKGVRVTRIA